MSRHAPFRQDPIHPAHWPTPADTRHTRGTLLDECLAGMRFAGPGCATAPDTGFEALMDWVEDRA